MKGLAPLISVLMLIVMSVVGSTVTYAFVNDFVGEATTGSSIPPITMVESVKTRNYDVTSVYMRNIGTNTLVVDRVYLLSPDGRAAGAYTIPSPLSVPPGQLVEITVEPWSLMAPKNGNYYVKVTTTEGGAAISSTFSLKRLYLVNWNEYAENPVFDPALRAYYPCVIYDANSFNGYGDSAKYKMWFGSLIGSVYTIGYAYSDDGIVWNEGANPISGLPSNAGHPWVLYFPDGFPGKNSGSGPSGATMHYRIWYWDVNKLYTVEALRYAESPDGMNWYNDQPLQNGAVPIITGIESDWNKGSYGPACILYNPSASNSGTDWTFMMYYDGTPGNVERIGAGFSSDGVTWTGYDRNGDGNADPVLTGSESAWDANYVYACTVLKIGSTYHMLYSGGIGSSNEGIGYATSSDGLTWNKDADNPIFHKSDGVVWRVSRTYCPAVVEVDGTFKMWFASVDGAGNYAISYATCT